MKLPGALNTGVSNEKKVFRIPRIAGLNMLPLQIATIREMPNLLSPVRWYTVGRTKTGVSETSAVV